MSDIFGIAPEDKACLECEMIKEAIKATEKRVVDDLINLIDKYNNGLTCCIALKNKIISDIENKYEVK